MAKGKKTGGRSLGTPNKVTIETQILGETFKEYFDKKDFSCAEEWFNIYEALRQAPEQLLFMDIRVKVLERITDRLHGKVKDSLELRPVFTIPADVQEAETPDLIRIAHAKLDS